MTWSRRIASGTKTRQLLRRFVAGTISLAIVSTLSGCNNAKSFVSYEESIQTIWDAYCTECHNSEKHDGDLVLTKPAPASFNQLVNVPATMFTPGRLRVSRSHPTESVLLDRVHWLNMPSGYPHPTYWKMPPGKQLSTEDQHLIGTWIIEKAPWDLN